jgi:two-component system cell cycle sensor histidine kinase/response regulator CckA
MNQPPPNKKTLLMVDDDPAILRFLSNLLADDFYVITADSGERALEQSKRFGGEIHLLLTDISMPKMNGIELARRIAAQRPEIKVVLMSGSNRDLLLPNHGWHFLSKPFRPSQLVALVDDLVSSPKSELTAA